MLGLDMANPLSCFAGLTKFGLTEPNEIAAATPQLQTVRVHKG